MSRLPTNVEEDCAPDCDFRVPTKGLPHIPQKQVAEESFPSTYSSGFGSFGCDSTDFEVSLRKLKIEDPPQEQHVSDVKKESKISPVTEKFDEGFSDYEIHEAFLQDEEGDTQLHIAIIQMLPAIVIQIIQLAKSYSHINIPNKLRQTPLHLAVHTNQPILVRALIASGAEVECRDLKGDTPLHIAARKGYLECAQYLTTPMTREEIQQMKLLYEVPFQKVPQSADLYNYEGHTCLHLAAAGNHREIIQYLVESNFRADINAKDCTSGRTILHHAVESNDIRFVVWLLTNFAVDINSTTYDQSIPLRLAAGRQFYDMYTLLLRSGAIDSGMLSDSDEDSMDEAFDDIEFAGEKV